jgi:orotate phosphoribosyltransferase
MLRGSGLNKMHEADVLRVLQEVGAILHDGHFVYTSGRHGRDYINKDALYPHTEATRQLTRALAEQCRAFDVDVVVGPALGGIILSQWAAYHLSQLSQREVLGVYCEKDADGKQVFRRGYAELVRSKRVLIVEDIVTTGQSVMQTAEVVRAAGGTVSAIIALINRDPRNVTSEKLGAPFLSLACVQFSSWSASECPLCAAGIPIDTRVGKGAEFLARRATRSFETDK